MFPSKSVLHTSGGSKASRQVAGGCLDAFGAPELTPGAAAEAFAARHETDIARSL